jgi:glycosyltransferase involved in cell wall biosynthesis
MRAAFVIGGINIGGASTYSLFLSSALRQLGVPCEIFSFSAGNPLTSEFADAGVPVHTQQDKPLIYEDRLQKVYADLRAFKPTVVFAVLGAESLEILRYVPPGVARVGIFHDRAALPKITVPIYRHSLDHFVVIAKYLLEDIREVARDFPCTYLAHGIPIPSDTAPRNPNSKEPLRLLYYGRFENISKGVRLFPEIATVLNRRGVPYRWTFHGSGPEESYLKGAFSAQIKTGQVVFSQPVRYAEVPGLIRKHDVYLLASTNEGGPLTLLESMALGLVPVCGDIPCLVQEVITSQNGFRVDRESPEAYADAIAKLNSNRELLERLSSSARQTITEHYSSRAMAERYIAFLNSLPIAANTEWPPHIRPRPILGRSHRSHLTQNLGIFRQIRRILKRLRNK